MKGLNRTGTEFLNPPSNPVELSRIGPSNTNDLGPIRGWTQVPSCLPVDITEGMAMPPCHPLLCQVVEGFLQVKSQQSDGYTKGIWLFPKGLRKGWHLYLHVPRH